MSKPKKKLDDMCTEYSGYALQCFVTDGGKGLRHAIWTAMVDAIQWDRENREAEAKKEKK